MSLFLVNLFHIVFLYRFFELLTPEVDPADFHDSAENMIHCQTFVNLAGIPEHFYEPNGNECKTATFFV